MPDFQLLWKWLTTDALGITIFGTIVATIILAVLQYFFHLPSRMWNWLKSVIRRARTPQPRYDLTVFEVYTDPATLLPGLYNAADDSPLADHNIPYQRRDSGHDLQAQLRQTLNQTGYVLLTGKSGVGKTREAATLALGLMNEGWRVVRITPGWLDEPKELPAEVKRDRRRWIVLLDDLNRLFGDQSQPEKTASEAQGVSTSTYRERLLRVLNRFEKECTKDELRVIATARDEAEQWQRLNYNAQDPFWKQFTRVEIQPWTTGPTFKAIQGLMQNTAQDAPEKELRAIAASNDGTFRNIALNLQRLLKANLPVTRENYTPTLDGSWRDSYQRVLARNPAVRYLYESMALLSQAGIELHPWLVQPFAQKLWGGNGLQRWWRRYRLRRAWRAITLELKVLSLSKQGKAQPYDGQLEVFDPPPNWLDHGLTLQSLLIKQPEKTRKQSLNSFFGFTASLYARKEFAQAIALMREVLKIEPASAAAYSNLGVLLADDP